MNKVSGSADPSLVGVSGFTGSLASTATSASELLPAATDSLQLSLLPNYLMVLWNYNYNRTGLGHSRL